MKKAILLLFILFLVGCSNEDAAKEEVNEKLNGIIEKTEETVQDAVSSVESATETDSVTVNTEDEEIAAEKEKLQEILSEATKKYEEGNLEGAALVLEQLEENKFLENEELYKDAQQLLQAIEPEFHTVFGGGLDNLQENNIGTEFQINFIRLGMTIEEASEAFVKPDSIDEMTGQANWTFNNGSYVVAFVMDSKINHIVATIPMDLLGEHANMGLGDPTAVDPETEVMYYYRGSDQYLSMFEVYGKLQMDLQYVDDRVKSLHE